MRLLAAIVGSLLALGAQSASAAPSYYSLMVNGVTRTLYMEVPLRFSASKPNCAVIGLHGGQGDGLNIAGQTNLKKYSLGAQRTGAGGFIAVYPNAVAGPQGTQWNDGRSVTAGQGDDVRFLEALVDVLVSGYGVKPDCVFLFGSSSGGMETQRVMCQSSKFRAFTANVSGLAQNPCTPSGPRPLNIYAGTADPYMPFNGGQVAPYGGTVLGNQATVDFWAANNRCGAPTTVELPPSVNDGTSISYTTRAGCALEQRVVRGGGHSWPGGATGNGTANLDGTATMIAFFKRFGL